MTLLSAVIDRHSMEAFMMMAHVEGLLNTDRETDGVFERICKTPVDYRIRQQLLEQLVLTPTLAFNRCPDFLWDALDGELKTEGNIINLDDPKTELSPQAESLSLDIIAGLVRAAGHDIPTSEFGPRADAAEAAAKEEDEYVRQSGKEAPSMVSKQLIDILNKINLGIPHDYTEEEYEAQRRRNEKYKAFAPIGAAIAEYLAVAQLAAKHDMLLKTPQFSEAGQTQLINPNFVAGAASDELVLFRVVATQLGKITFRPTIKGSLALARDPATIALREQLQLWQTELPSGDEAQLKAIQKEIDQANRAMSRLSGVETVGTITTWLSVPVAIAELVMALPPVLGISIGVVGKVSSASAMAITRKYKWAMFGNSQ
jgi:hypothetical protein